MATIYRNALLTIAADAAIGGRTGRIYATPELDGSTSWEMTVDYKGSSQPSNATVSPYWGSSEAIERSNWIYETYPDSISSASRRLLHDA